MKISESACECNDDGTVECSDRCVAPLQPSGRASDDPLCVEQVRFCVKTKVSFCGKSFSVFVAKVKFL